MHAVRPSLLTALASVHAVQELLVEPESVAYDFSGQLPTTASAVAVHCDVSSWPGPAFEQVEGQVVLIGFVVGLYTLLVATAE